MKLSKGSYVGFRIDEGGGTVGIQGNTHIGAITVRLILIQMMPPLPAMVFQGVLMFLLRFLTWQEQCQLLCICHFSSCPTDNRSFAHLTPQRCLLHLAGATPSILLLVHLAPRAGLITIKVLPFSNRGKGPWQVKCWEKRLNHGWWVSTASHLLLVLFLLIVVDFVSRCVNALDFQYTGAL